MKGGRERGEDKWDKQASSFLSLVDIRVCLYADRNVPGARLLVQERGRQLPGLYPLVGDIGWDPVARIIPTLLHNCPQISIWL